MAAGQGTFGGFDPYILREVQVTDNEFGRGSYASVVQLEYRGLKCAGKRLYQVLHEQGIGHAVRRFEEECRLLSQTRHPNVVQFLGVFFEHNVRIPMLVMEFLPTNLTSCVKQYGVLPKEINYTILLDVSLGLNYLHSQTPPIIHRDLSSNNVLLTPNMTAKISDLGVAKILNLTPMEISRMSETPGTPAFMPPEVMVADPRYDTIVDIFSYGVMMIHVISGEWPAPKCEPVRVQSGQLIPVSEAERREEYLHNIGDDHPLMDLIRRCVNNDPQMRGSTTEIISQLNGILAQSPPSFANRVEMMNQIKILEEERRDLVAKDEEKDEEIEALKEKNRLLEVKNEEKDEEIEAFKEESRVLEAKGNEKDREIEALKQEKNVLVAICVRKDEEIGDRLAQVRQIERKSSALQEQYQEAIADLTLAYSTQIEHLELAHSIEIEQLRLKLNTEEETISTEKMAQMESGNNLQIDNIRSEIHGQFAEACTQKTDIEQLETLLSTSQQELTLKEQECRSQSEEKAVGDNLMKESGITSKWTTTQKDFTISKLNEQLMKTREYLSSKLQPTARISWKECSQLPFPSSLGQTVVIENKVYYGGFLADNDENIICCYDPSEDDWSTLPQLPVKYFSLGRFKGKLVAVGGRRISDGQVTKQVNVFDEKTQKWIQKQSFPPMITARIAPTVISHNDALIVIGGLSISGDVVDTVELYRSNTSQWYATDSLPAPCRSMSSAVIQDTCYLIGGYNGSLSPLNQIVCASIEQLINNATPLHQSSLSGCRVDTQQSAWKKLANTPVYDPTAAVVLGTVLAIGGSNSDDFFTSENIQSAVYAYSSDFDSWIYTSDIQAPCCDAATVVLSPVEIMVIGGYHEKPVNTVYLGTFSVV